MCEQFSQQKIYVELEGFPKNLQKGSVAGIEESRWRDFGRQQPKTSFGEFFFFFKSSPKDVLIDFREREGEREATSGCLLQVRPGMEPPTENLCPGGDSNPLSFGVQHTPTS